MRLPVLMYHKISENEKPGRLNVTPDQLESHLRHLSLNGFNAISVSQLISCITGGKKLAKRPVLLTFDDGYKTHFTNLYPLLIKYNFKAVIFLTASYIQTGDHLLPADHLHIDEIRGMQKQYVEYGLHTFDHKNYEDLSPEAVKEDIDKTMQRLSALTISFQPCFAYSYGAFPRKDEPKRKSFDRIFEEKGIQLVFRIGNRINLLPFRNKFLIQRIDMTGNDPMWKFKLMCRFGKKWLPF